MARVVVRVELHGATTEWQYEQLHMQMADAGFRRMITGSSGSHYWLPAATYCSEGYRTEAAARDAAWEAAAGVVPSYAVIATCGDSAWHGLIEVRTAA